MRNIAFWVAAVLAFVFFPDELDGDGLLRDIALFLGVLLVAGDGALEALAPVARRA